MIFRGTDFLKSEKQIERQLRPGIKNEELGRAVRMRDFKIDKEDGDIITFRQGTYNKASGMVKYSSKELPYFVEKLTRLHKADTKNPLFFQCVFWVVAVILCSLFFLDVSAKYDSFQERLVFHSIWCSFNIHSNIHLIILPNQ